MRRRSRSMAQSTRRGRAPDRPCERSSRRNGGGGTSEAARPATRPEAPPCQAHSARSASSHEAAGAWPVRGRNARRRPVPPGSAAGLRREDPRRAPDAAGTPGVRSAEGRAAASRHAWTVGSFGPSVVTPALPQSVGTTVFDRVTLPQVLGADSMSSRSGERSQAIGGLYRASVVGPSASGHERYDVVVTNSSFLGCHCRGVGAEGVRYSTTTMAVAPRPKVSGWYISSARGGGTTNRPGVVARAT